VIRDTNDQTTVDLFCTQTIEGMLICGVQIQPFLSIPQQIHMLAHISPVVQQRSCDIRGTVVSRMPVDVNGVCIETEKSRDKMGFSMIKSSLKY
jgi:hypothetical protein